MILGTHTVAELIDRLLLPLSLSPAQTAALFLV